MDLTALATRFANALTRGRHAQSAYDPAGRRTLMQITGMAGEVFQSVELILPYGMSAVPVGNTADVLTFQVLGHRDHKVALGPDDPALRIPSLGQGEFGFRDQNGQQVVWRAASGGYLEITCNKLVATVTGDADVTSSGGNINLTANSGKITMLAETNQITANGHVLG